MMAARVVPRAPPAIELHNYRLRNMGTWNQRDLQTLLGVETVAACDVY
jgi:hypothetical protein